MSLWHGDCANASRTKRWGLKSTLKRKSWRLDKMRYGIAWLLGVPVSVLVVWFLVSHLL